MSFDHNFFCTCKKNKVYLRTKTSICHQNLKTIFKKNIDQKSSFLTNTMCATQ